MSMMASPLELLVRRYEALFGTYHPPSELHNVIYVDFPKGVEGAESMEIDLREEESRKD
jgi:hypothetical protein